MAIKYNWILISSATTLLGLFTLLYQKKLKNFIGKDRRQRYFAQLFDEFHIYYNQETHALKVALFKPLLRLQSKVPSLRDTKCIRILEIGTGSGANLEYYPPNCHLISVDPNPYFGEYFRQNLKKTPGIVLEKCSLASADDMNDIESESIDVVVSTLVCCGVPNLRKVYAEIHRILVPGGKFMYMEHILDRPGTRTYFWQKLLSMTGYWPFILECSLDRNLDQEVIKCGLFSSIDQNRLYLNPVVFRYLSPHVTGTATK